MIETYIQQINQQLTPQELGRLQTLEQKLAKQESFTKSEKQEMNKLVEKTERLHTQRILAIVRLAQLLGSTVEEISREFGFQPISNDQNH